ncbi:uracil nucleotide/cysteinyl leukotriene receptor [Clupea harengus]|uniref:Uracil nucleotide/cysteinyl leukotriene receptor n=1 Tax=Clupea harengus TaxID=7950 RepID=A0A6P3WFB5_CLUHA|nr:uracil nucleotide/cysteinyl leukotriene receptor [Clupea harengus]
MNHTMNHTMDTKERFLYHSVGSHGENVFLSVFYTIVLVLSVPANAMALWVFCHPKNGSSSARVFLTHLALADMCYVLLLPMRVVYHASGGDWILGEAACRLSGFLFYLNLYCSLYFMTSISFDRFLAVVFPIRSLSWRKPAYAKVACAILWVTLTVSMAPVMASKQTMAIPLGVHNVTVCQQLYLERTSPLALRSLAVAFALPLVVLSLSYVLILFKLRAVKRQTPVHLKAKRMVVLTLVNFLVAFLPYHIHRFFYIVRYNQHNVSEEEVTSLSLGNRVTSALTCVNGVIDPLMYFFLTETYQRALLKLLGRAESAKTDQHSKPGSGTSSAF